MSVTIETFETLSPARKAYIQKQAKKKGKSLDEYIEDNRAQVPSQTYPFSKIEDSQFRLHEATTDKEKLKVHELTLMFRKYYDGLLADYPKNADKLALDPEVGINTPSCKADGVTFYLVQIGNKDVGLVKLNSMTHKEDPNKNLTYLEDIFIQPKYSGWGVATRVYNEVFGNPKYNCTTINIAYGRVVDNTDYWKKWFHKFFCMQDQAGHERNYMIYLTNENKHTPEPEDNAGMYALNYFDLVTWKNGFKARCAYEYEGKTKALRKFISQQIQQGA